MKKPAANRLSNMQKRGTKIAPLSIKASPMNKNAISSSNEILKMIQQAQEDGKQFSFGQILKSLVASKFSKQSHVQKSRSLMHNS